MDSKNSNNSPLRIVTRPIRYGELSTKDLAKLIRNSQSLAEFLELRKVSQHRLHLELLRNALYDRIEASLLEPISTDQPPVATIAAAATDQPRPDHIQQDGIRYDLSEWVTLSEYATRHGLKSTNTVNNWISRGIVPPDCTVELRSLNGLRLIRNQPYRPAPG